MCVFVGDVAFGGGKGSKKYIYTSQLNIYKIFKAHGFIKTYIIKIIIQQRNTF